MKQAANLALIATFVLNTMAIDKYLVPNNFTISNIAFAPMCETLQNDIELKFMFAEFVASINLSKDTFFEDSVIRMKISIIGLSTINSEARVTTNGTNVNFNNNVASSRLLQVRPDDIWTIKISSQNNVEVLATNEVYIRWVIYDSNVELTQVTKLTPVKSSLATSITNNGSSVGLDSTCYKFAIKNSCHNIFADSVVKISYPPILDYSFGMFTYVPIECALKLNDSGNTYTCNSTAQSIGISNLFQSDTQLQEITLEICDLVNPPFKTPQQLLVEVISNEVTCAEGFLYASSTQIMRFSSILVSGQLQAIGNQFEVQAFYSIKNSFVISASLVVQIDIPEDFINVSTLSFTFTNAGTKGIIIKNNNKAVKDRQFLVEVKVKALDLKTGFYLTVNGFAVPGGIGKQKLGFTLLDKETNKQIAATDYLEFNVASNSVQLLEVELSDYGIGKYVIGDFSILIPTMNVSNGQFDLEINMKNGLSLTDQNVDSIVFLTRTLYDSVQINLAENVITIKNLILNVNNLSTYIRFTINGIRNSYTDAFNAAVTVLLVNQYQNIWEQTTNFDLDYLELSIVDKNLHLSNNSFVLDIAFSYNTQIAFDHYLRINVPKSFQIDFDKPCYTGSNLPYSNSIGLCIKGEGNYSNELFNRTSILLFNALRDSQDSQIYTLSIQGTLDKYVEYRENILIDIIGQVDGKPTNTGSSSISEASAITSTFDCPEFCQQCDTSTAANMLCLSCINNLLIYAKNNTCITTLPNDDTDTPNTASDLDETKTKVLQYVVEKLFVGFYYNLIAVQIVSTVFLKFTFGNRIILLEFSTIMLSATQYWLNYFILAHSWNIDSSKLKISVINIVIIVFWVSNLVTSLYIVIKSHNNTFDNIQVVGIKSTSLILLGIYVIFGSGCFLWVSAFRMSDIYVKILLPEDQMKTFKNLVTCIVYTNILFILILTVSIASVMFLFENNANHMTIIYLVNGILTFCLYLTLIFLRKKHHVNKKLGFATETRAQHFDYSFVKPVHIVPVLYAESAENLADDTSAELMMLKDEDLHPELRRWVENIETFKKSLN